MWQRQGLFLSRLEVYATLQETVGDMVLGLLTNQSERERSVSFARQHGYHIRAMGSESKPMRQDA